MKDLERFIAKCEENSVPDNMINTSDIPELTGEDFARGHFRNLKEDSTVSMTATTVFKTSVENKARIQKLAKLTNRSVSYYLNILLNDYLEDLEDIYLSEQILADIKLGKETTYSLEEVKKELGL